jgi:hypothetical protein
MALKAIIRLLAAAAFVAGGVEHCAFASACRDQRQRRTRVRQGRRGQRHSLTPGPSTRLFSEYATQGLDTNKDGVLSRDELAELAKVNVETLQGVRLLHLRQERSRASSHFGQPTDYWLEHKDKLLTLHFTLPVKTGDRRRAASRSTFSIRPISSPSASRRTIR